MGVKKNERYKKKVINKDWVEGVNQEQIVEKFNKLSRIMGDYSGYEASDGQEYNLLSWKPRLLEKIKHLPEYEQKFIIHKFDRMSKLKPVLGRIKNSLRKYVGDNYETSLELRKAEIFELYSLFYTTEEIHKKLLEDSGMNISYSSLKRFYLKYKVEIEKRQLEYEKQIGSAGISRKKSRIEILDYMLRKIKQEFDSVDGLKLLPYSREMARILEQARKEVEGDVLHLNVDGTININATIESAKSVEKLYSDINFMNLLISRVAARMNFNPLMLQYQLTNSWYSKFTGIKRNNFIMVETPKYPSSIILNWNELSEKAEAKEKELKDIEDKFTQDIECEVVDEDRIRSEKLRAALKNKMKDRQIDLDNIKNRVLSKK